MLLIRNSADRNGRFIRLWRAGEPIVGLSIHREDAERLCHGELLCSQHASLPNSILKPSASSIAS